MSGQNWPHVLNLSNSIIGVTVLAMPFCYKECGILLGTLLLFFSTWLTLISCQLLMKAGVTSRKRSYGFLAQYTHGAPGKIAVEVGMIGLQIGTLIAQVVIIGDLGPAIVSKWTGLQNTGHLRTALIVVLCLGVGLPLGLLRNLTAVSRASTLCIMFYSVFVLYVMILSIPNLRAANWIDKVNLWRTDGMFKCLPIFSFAFGCQTQLFILYDALPEPSLKEIKSIVGTAVNMCTVAYLLVGFFGYIAFCDKDIGGDIITQFSETFTSDLLKVGFVISIAITFPLIIFPCRGSLYTLLFPQRPKHSEDIESRPVIPEIHFKALTVAIVAVAMTTGVLVPNVEFVLAMNGATMGTLICYTFPAIFFLRVMTGTTGKNLAQFVLIIGLTIMVLCTYTTLNSQDQMQPEPIIVPKVSTKPSLADQAALHKPPVDNIHVEKKDIVGDEKPPDPLDKSDQKKKEEKKDNGDIRIEPPNPKAPDDKVVDKNESNQDKPEVMKDEAESPKKEDIQEEKKDRKSKSKKLKRTQDEEKVKDSEGVLEQKKEHVESEGKKAKVEAPESDVKNAKVEEKDKEKKENKDSETKDITKDVKHEEKEIIKELKKQQAEQKKLIEEQKEILHELKQHKQLEHDNKQLLKELNLFEEEQIDGQENQQEQAQLQPAPKQNQQQPILANQPPVDNKQKHVFNQQQPEVANPQVPVFANQQNVNMANQLPVHGNPPVNQQLPAQQPVANQQQAVPNQQQVVPVANQQPGVAYKQQPVPNQQVPLANQQPVAANPPLIMVNQQKPLIGNVANQQPGGINNKTVMVNQPGIANQQHVVVNQHEGVNQQPVVSNQQQVVANQQPIASNQQPLLVNQQPAMANQPAFANQQPLMANQQNPVVVNQQPVIANQPVMANQQPIMANQQPVVANQQPVVANQQPLVANQPAVANQQPIMAKQPSMANQQPMMANQQVNLQQAGVANQLNVNQQQGVVVNQQQAAQQQQILVDSNKNVNIQQPVQANLQNTVVKEKVAQNIIKNKVPVQNSQQGVLNQQPDVQDNKAGDSQGGRVKRHKRDVSDSENAAKDKHKKDVEDNIDETEHKKVPHGDEMRRKKLEFNEVQENLELDEALKSLTKHVSPGAQVNGVMRSLKSLRQKSTK